MDNKERKIKEVYNGYVGEIDKDGWTNWKAIEHFGINNLDCQSYKKQMMQYRPKVLSGIEDNNGWKEVDWNNNDIEFGKLYHFIPNGNFNERFVGFISNRDEEVYFFDPECFDSLKTPSTHKNYIQLNSWLRMQLTHYQEIDVKHKNVY